MKMNKWSSQWTQLMQLREEEWKKKFRTSKGFEPVTLRLPVTGNHLGWNKYQMYLGGGRRFERRRESFLPALLSCQCYCQKQIDCNLSWSVLLLAIEMTSKCSKLCSFWRHRDRFVNYPLERFQSVFFTQPSVTIKRRYERERTRARWVELDFGVFRAPPSYFDPFLFFRISSLCSFRKYRQSKF